MEFKQDIEKNAWKFAFLIEVVGIFIFTESGNWFL